MPPKLPALREALEGRFDVEHQLLIGSILAYIDFLDEAIDRLSEAIEEQIAPFAAPRDLLMTIPGVKQRTAEVLIAEIGTDMSAFHRRATGLLGRRVPRQRPIGRQAPLRRHPQGLQVAARDPDRRRRDDRPVAGHRPVPLAPPSEPIDGDSHAHLLPPLRRLADELGYTVEVLDLARRPGRMVRSQGQGDRGRAGPANRQVRTLVHELAHALGISYASHTREQAEVLVDCVTYVVLGSVGLDVGVESIPYVAGWGEDGALDAIRTCAATIDEVARRIEDAIAPATAAPADAPTELQAA